MGRPHHGAVLPPLLRALLLLLASWSVSLATAAARASIAGDPEETVIAPIIGVFAQPSHHAGPPCGGDCQYIAASYIKWLESAGGRAVPIPYDAPAPLLDALFPRLHGLLLPGGGNPLPPAVSYMLEAATRANEGGDFFPVWGTCLGYEWMMLSLAAAGGDVDFKLDADLDAWNISLPLEYTPLAGTSRLFRDMDPSLLALAGTAPLAMNNHHKGTTPQTFASAPSLADGFDVLSLSHDRLGRAFVSTVEHRRLPFYATQWHPEKPLFEWGTVPDPSTGRPLPYEAINHSLPAQALAAYVAQFFLAQARRSRGHGFASQEEEAACLVYNYGASPASAPEFSQAYYFQPETWRPCLELLLLGKAENGQEGERSSSSARRLRGGASGSAGMG